MVLTRDFKDTIKDRVERNPSFREELFKEGIECFLTDELILAKLFCVIISTPLSVLMTLAKSPIDLPKA